MKKRLKVYLDHSATTPVDPIVLEAMLPYFTTRFGNPSSVHSFGLDARSGVEQTRTTLARILNAHESEIIFTSGGTEADNLAIQGIARANRSRGNHIITSAVEHPAVLNTCQKLEKEGFEVTYVKVDQYGMVSPEDVEAAIRKDTILITIIHANNEVGTINPIAEIGEIASKHNIPFHTDAVQTFGKLPIDVNKMNLSALSLSSHKIYGPKGCGALFIRKGIPISPLLHGGEHERSRRAGTLNVPGIVGLGIAAELCYQKLEKEQREIQAVRDYFQKRILQEIDNVTLNGHPTQRLFHNLNCSFIGCENDSLLLHLDMHGIAVSTGSACHSGSVEPSHVIKAMGFDNQRAKSVIRFTLGRSNTREQIDYTVEVLKESVNRLRKMTRRK